MRTLTLEDLINLANTDGTLPYQKREVRSLVWELKYQADPRATALAGAYLADLLLTLRAEELSTPILIPIPMHPKRRRERGHNHTELLCEAALDHLENAYAYAPSVLARMVHTPQQQGLERHKRLKNVHQSMKIVEPKIVQGRVCVVVDDVTTTGATFAEAKRALLSAGASAVHCVALAQS